MGSAFECPEELHLPPDLPLRWTTVESGQFHLKARGAAGKSGSLEGVTNPVTAYQIGGGEYIPAAVRSADRAG